MLEMGISVAMADIVVGVAICVTLSSSSIVKLLCLGIWVLLVSFGVLKSIGSIVRV